MEAIGVIEEERQPYNDDGIPDKVNFDGLPSSIKLFTCVDRI